MLAIDPGRYKTGLAVVTSGGKVLFRRVVTREELLEAVETAWYQYAPVAVVVGDRTGAKELLDFLEEHGPPGIRGHIQFVHEDGTSLAARALYWKENPPRGWRRLLPEGLRQPPVPVDDFAAVILAYRYFSRMVT